MVSQSLRRRDAAGIPRVAQCSVSDQRCQAGGVAMCGDPEEYRTYAPWSVTALTFGRTEVA